jgi:hypothetical protein
VFRIIGLLTLSVTVCDLHAPGALFQVMLLLPALPANLNPPLLRLLIELPNVAALAGVLEPEDLPLQGIQEFGIQRECLDIELILPQNLSQVRMSILFINSFQGMPIN